MATQNKPAPAGDEDPTSPAAIESLLDGLQSVLRKAAEDGGEGYDQFGEGEPGAGGEESPGGGEMPAEGDSGAEPGGEPGGDPGDGSGGPEEEISDEEMSKLVGQFSPQTLMRLYEAIKEELSSRQGDGGGAGGPPPPPAAGGEMPDPSAMGKSEKQRAALVKAARDQQVLLSKAVAAAVAPLVKQVADLQKSFKRQQTSAAHGVPLRRSQTDLSNVHPSTRDGAPPAGSGGSGMTVSEAKARLGYVAKNEKLNSSERRAINLFTLDKSAKEVPAEIAGIIARHGS